MDAWQRLSEISKLQFVARSANDSGWNGTGNGAVLVAKLDANTIMFTETGQWKSGTGQELNFNNVFRWSFDASGGTIRLEHLRYGSNNPVYLFDLALKDDNMWHSITPHVCRDDSYAAIMNLAVDHIELRWTIKGPQKDENIHYWYS